jgi:hypothetical protein
LKNDVLPKKVEEDKSCKSQLKSPAGNPIENCTTQHRYLFTFVNIPTKKFSGIKTLEAKYI